MQHSSIDMSLLGAGFAASVLDAQSSFKAILNALSFPGRTFDIPAPPDAPGAWPPALAAAALTLLDADTPVFMDDLACSDAAKAFIRFHAGAPIVETLDAAQFAILLAPEQAEFDAFRIGEDQYPDRSATLLCAVSGFTGGRQVRLTGPGVKTAEDIAPEGLGDRFWNAWARNHALYPLGYDVVLAADASVIGLPRSISATALEA